MSELTEPTLQWQTVKRKVKDLIPFEYNPRILTEEKKEKLKASLSRFNLAEIPAINTDNKIIAGHQRVKVMLELGRGEEVIDVRIPNRLLTDKEFKEYNITSNIPTGYWDLDVLDEIFSDIDLESLGLNIDDIVVPDSLIPEELQNEEELDFDPTPKPEPISKIGDVYVLKSLDKDITHRVICGDSTEEATFKHLLGSDKIALTVTDPPYNVDYRGGSNNKRESIKNDKHTDSDFYNFLLAFYSATLNHHNDGAPIYVFHADSEGLNFRKAFNDSGFKLSQCLIWNKNSATMSRQDYHWKHEPCLYGWKPGAAHTWYSDRKQKTVLDFDRPIRSEEHPTMKPLDLICYLISNSSKRCDIVFDAFSGSGSVLISGEMLWRNVRAIELDPAYVDVNIKRYLNYMSHNKRNFEVYLNGALLTKEQLNTYMDE